MTDTSISSPYFWTPGAGPDPNALRRLRALTRLPKQAMGEAWFMSEERRRFVSLMHDDPHQWPDLDLSTALFELSSGTVSFGPQREWHLWCAFLLPRALELLGPGADPFRARRLHPALVTAALIHLEQPAFAHLPPHVPRDLLDTLGRAMFEPSLWREGRMRANAWCLPFDRRTVYGETIDPSQPFAASCALALKLLEPAQLPGWLSSALAIEDPYWRAAWVTWLHAAAPMILDGAYPDELDPDDSREWNSYSLCGSRLAVWENSHVLKRETRVHLSDEDATRFIDTARRDAFVAALRGLLGRGRSEQWAIALYATETHRGQLDCARSQYRDAARGVLERYALD